MLSVRGLLWFGSNRFRPYYLKVTSPALRCELPKAPLPSFSVVGKWSVGKKWLREIGTILKTQKKRFLCSTKMDFKWPESMTNIQPSSRACMADVGKVGDTEMLWRRSLQLLHVVIWWYTCSTAVIKCTDNSWFCLKLGYYLSPLFLVSHIHVVKTAPIWKVGRMNLSHRVWWTIHIV